MRNGVAAFAAAPLGGAALVAAIAFISTLFFDVAAEALINGIPMLFVLISRSRLCRPPQRFADRRFTDYL